MQNVKNYFSSWKIFSKSPTDHQWLTLSPSTIHFTDSKFESGDGNSLLDISRKFLRHDSPPKLQICQHENQWFALNNSHLLVYRQLERLGLCDTVVCDVIRQENVPHGIRQSLKTSDECQTLLNDEGSNSQDEVMYCADIRADSCAYLPGEQSQHSDEESDHEQYACLDDNDKEHQSLLPM